MHAAARQALIQGGPSLAPRHIRVGQHQEASWVPPRRCLQLLHRQQWEGLALGPMEFYRGSGSMPVLRSCIPRPGELPQHRRSHGWPCLPQNHTAKPPTMPTSLPPLACSTRELPARVLVPSTYTSAFGTARRTARRSFMPSTITR